MRLEGWKMWMKGSESSGGRGGEGRGREERGAWRLSGASVWESGIRGGGQCREQRLESGRWSGGQDEGGLSWEI